jgi:hypothetical protein
MTAFQTSACPPILADSAVAFYRERYRDSMSRYFAKIAEKHQAQEFSHYASQTLSVCKLGLGNCKHNWKFVDLLNTESVQNVWFRHLRASKSWPC